MERAWGETGLGGSGRSENQRESVSGAESQVGAQDGGCWLFRVTCGVN